MNGITSTTTHNPRASHKLPKPIFNAILDLETQAAHVATLDANADSREYLDEAIKTGFLRDQLAQLLLDAGLVSA